MTSYTAQMSEALSNVLALLDAFGKRTSMYVCDPSIDAVQNFLHGLEAGCAIGGLNISRDIYVKAAAMRGWEFRASGIVWHMESKGFSKDEIIQELVEVEKESFRLATVDAV